MKSSPKSDFRALHFMGVWVKMKPPEHHRFSMFPLARVPFGAPIFDSHGFPVQADPIDGSPLRPLGAAQPP